MRFFSRELFPSNFVLCMKRQREIHLRRTRGLRWENKIEGLFPKSGITFCAKDVWYPGEGYYQKDKN